MVFVLANMSGAAIQGLFARFIAFCLNDPEAASECLKYWGKQWSNDSWFSEAAVDFWKLETGTNDVIKIDPTSFITNIGSVNNSMENCRVSQVRNQTEIEKKPVRSSLETSKKRNLKRSSRQRDDNGMMDSDEYEVHSAVEHSAEEFSEESTDFSSSTTGSETDPLAYIENDSLFDSLKEEYQTDGSLSSKEAESEPSLLEVLMRVPFGKSREFGLESAKLSAWRNKLAEQISSAELRNQFPGKTVCSLAILNKFAFIEDFDYDVIYEEEETSTDETNNCAIIWWMAELNLNRGMLKFYGFSKVKSNTAMKNALRAALHFCTLKVLHEKVIPRHLRNNTKFLIFCFLNYPEMRNIGAEFEKLPQIELKRKKKHSDELIAKRRKRSKSCGEIEVRGQKSSANCAGDDPSLFEVNFKTENMFFCFERYASNRWEAINGTLLHILKNRLNFSVI